MKKIFPEATLATEPKTKETQIIARIYAGILVLLALSQLFTFDEFMGLLSGLGFPGGEPIAYFAGGMLVACEVFALPFLLGVTVSPLMRIVSMACGWMVAFGWLKISVWLVATDASVMNVGFLGTLVNLTPGWWAVCFTICLGLMAGWTSWGYWPIKKRPAKKS